MTTPLVVEVTQAHIEKGQAGSSHWCPIALALRETFPNASYVAVEAGELYVAIDGADHSYNMTEEIERFVERFDDHDDSVQPFSFTLKESQQ